MYDRPTICRRCGGELYHMPVSSFNADYGFMLACRMCGWNDWGYPQ